MSILYSYKGVIGGIKGYSLNNGAAAITAGDLDEMTVIEIKSLAADRGYTIRQTRKADITQEFLAQQEV